MGKNGINSLTVRKDKDNTHFDPAEILDAAMDVFMFGADDMWGSEIERKLKISKIPVMEPPEARQSEASIATPEISKSDSSTPVVEESFSADQWLDIMEGKTEEQEMPPNAADEKVHFLDTVDYAAKHAVPERQAPREKKTEQVREGLTKREYFDSVKLSYRKTFAAGAKRAARICSSCAPGDKAGECISCGAKKATIMAKLCEKCASDKKTSANCVKCGKPNSKAIAKYCERCGPSHLRTCARCGARL